MENAYVAVRADLVVLARNLFHIRPSMLDAGPKRLLLTAHAICDGKSDDRWGHHATPIVMKFCQYTATATQPPLPWQELLEDTNLYDGREGVSLRTGNRPLGTLERYEVDAAAITRAMKSKATTPEAIAAALELPEPFVQSIATGDWPSISAATRDLLVQHLGHIELSRLAQPRQEESIPAPTQRALRWPLSIVIGLMLLLVAGVALWGRGGEAPAVPAAAEIVGYWDYDGIDGQKIPHGLVLIPSPGSGMGVTWQQRLEMLHHDQLPERARQLWPVELYRSARKVCINYPDYPSYVGFIDLPGDGDDGIYRFGPCE